MFTRIRALLARLASPDNRVVRSVACELDIVAEYAWEIFRYLLTRLPSHGEMNAIVRRMGMRGITEYTVAQMQGHFGHRSFLPVDGDRVAADFRERFPGEAETTLAAAERTSRGEFDIFGSGPVDVRRGRWGGGQRIDWRLDPTTGRRYPRIFSHFRWNPYKIRVSDADIKGAWELTRCQHFAAMGQAYWLTGDERFARCFAKTITDFLRHNPPGFGIHWACPMDVGLRVVGWLVGLSFFDGSRALSFRWWRRFLKGLVAHGRFLAANLEFGNIDKRLVTANHYTANLLGLYWISACFPHIDAGTVWRGLAEGGLEREIRRQILADGGGFEASVPYHRLSVEMFLSAYALSCHFGAPLSNGYRRRLLAGLRFVRALRQPGGRWPQIGDADDGRAHILTGYGTWSQESMDHLLAAGAHVLNCAELVEGLADDALVEQIFWGAPTGEPVTLPPIPNPAVFPDFGVAVVHGGGSWVSLSNGPVGTDGFGNHKHNDQLAIEWVVGEQPLLVDGGSYIYTRDPEARNRFRATAQHNTVMVAGSEQNGLDPDALFRMDQQGTCAFDHEVLTDGLAGVSGFHSAYARLDPPVVHRRRVLVREADGIVVVDDVVEGGNQHPLRWHFLLAPGVMATVENGIARLGSDKGGGEIRSPATISWRMKEAWYSPGYGRRTATQALVADVTGGGERMTLVLVPAGAASIEPADASALIDTHFPTARPVG